MAPLNVFPKHGFGVGDRVRHRGINPATAHEYEVMALHPDGVHVWLEKVDGGPKQLPYTGIAAVYQKIEPFFQPGKLYRRRVAWSIWAQADDVVEEFHCTVVEANTNGKRVAFGRVFINDLGPGTKPFDEWMALGEYQFGEKWEEA